MISRSFSSCIFGLVIFWLNRPFVFTISFSSTSGNFLSRIPHPYNECLDLLPLLLQVLLEVHLALVHQLLRHHLLRIREAGPVERLRLHQRCHLREVLSLHVLRLVHLHVIADQLRILLVYRLLVLHFQSVVLVLLIPLRRLVLLPFLKANPRFTYCSSFPLTSNHSASSLSGLSAE